MASPASAPKSAEELENEAKVIEKSIIHGQLHGCDLAVCLLFQTSALEQKVEEQRFVFEVIAQRLFDTFRCLTTFFQKEANQPNFSPIFSMHSKHQQLWEDYYLGDWNTYQEKQGKEWKNYKYSQSLPFRPQGKTNPESPDSTFEYIFPIDSAKGVIGYAVAHFHQLNFTDEDMKAVDFFLELTRGYYYRSSGAISSAKGGGPKKSPPAQEKEEQGDEAAQGSKWYGKFLKKIEKTIKIKKAG